MYYYIVRITLILLLLSASSVLADTVIDAQVVRNQTGSGSTLISSGFPFPPGLVSESHITQGTIVVVVDGVEVAANVTALRGRHSDGSIRSALIQFTVDSMAEDDTLTATVSVNDSIQRIYADPAYTRPTYAIVENNNTILPTDPDYITTTLVTLEGLLPTGDGTATEEKLYTAYADLYFEYLLVSQNLGTASYDHPRGMVGLWARSGNIKYFNEAVAQILAWLPYNTCLDPACNADPYINPDGRIGTNPSNGLAAEQYTFRYHSYATMYLLTGYRDFWSIVAYNLHWQRWNITDQATATTQIAKLSQNGFPRTSLHFNYGALIPAYSIDATLPVPGNSYPVHELSWDNELSWTLNAIAATEWDVEWIPFNSGSGIVPAIDTVISQGAATSSLLAVYETQNAPITAAGSAMPTSGYLKVTGRTGDNYSAGALSGISASATGVQTEDYRNGMVGIMSSNPYVAPYLASAVFQISITNNWLIDYYLLVDADSRIPTMVKSNVDIYLQNISSLESGDSCYGGDYGAWGTTEYGNPYNLANPIGSLNSVKSPWTLPDGVPRAIAFVVKTLGEDVVNGASYATWYSRVLNTANIYTGCLTPQWKLFGQFYGTGGMDTGWINAQSSLSVPVYRTPTIYAAIPGDTPDLEREGGPLPPSYQIFFNQTGTINFDQTGTINFN